jgi:hypothetical protein
VSPEAAEKSRMISREFSSETMRGAFEKAERFVRDLSTLQYRAALPREPLSPGVFRLRLAGTPARPAWRVDFVPEAVHAALFAEVAA